MPMTTATTISRTPNTTPRATPAASTTASYLYYLTRAGRTPIDSLHGLALLVRP